jgi:peroxiredoxin
MKLVMIILMLICFSNSFGQTPAKKQISLDSLLHSFNKKSDSLIGTKYQQFSFTDEKGDLFSNANFTGKVSFINFWFEACAPCRAEMESLNELYLKFKGNQNFTFISFTYEPFEKLQLLKEKYHLKYPIISIKKEECYRLNQNSGFPTNIILDKNGIMQYLNFGGFIDKEKVENYFSGTLYPKINGMLLSYTN